MRQQTLKRVLNRFDAAVLGFGAIIGWGWIILAGTWVSNAGVAGASLAFLVGAVAIIVIGLTYAELSSAMPFAGGEHAYTERAFGKAASFICTWALIFGYVAVVAFEAIALPVAVVYLAPEFKAFPLWDVAGYTVHASEAALGAVAAIVITVLNIWGVRIAVRAQASVVLILLAAAGVLIAGGLTHLDRVPANLDVWRGFPGVFAVVIMVPFLFVGFDVIPQSAEEIAGPKGEIGRALILSIVLAVAYYLIIVFSVGLAPLDPNAVDIATADAAGAWWRSDKAAAFVIIAGIGGVLTSWNSFLIGGSRALFAMARAQQLPAFLAVVHPRFGTPWAAIALVGGVSAFAPLLGRNALVWIVNAGGFGITIAYAFVAAAFVALRRREPDLARPYRAPGGVYAGAAAFILAAGIFALYLPWSPSALAWPAEWGLIAGWGALGFFFWLLRPTRSRNQ
ncbi:MAG: APC family permease [Parvularculaceae bacterium]